MEANSGMSLIGVMVSLAVMSVFFTLSAKSYKNMMATQKSFELRTERVSINQYLMQKVDCRVTTGDGSCDGHYVHLKDFFGRSVINPQNGRGQKFGSYYVRAICESYEVVVQVSRKPRPANRNFYKDPLTGLPATWKKVSPIPLCADASGGS